MKNLYAELGRTAHKTHESERSLGSSFGKVAVILFLLLFSLNKVNAQCTHTIQLTDTYGDGWNGGAVSVSVNGTVVLTNITLGSGFGPTSYNFTASSGQTIRVYTSIAGSWASERRIRVVNNVGADVIALVGVANGSATSGGRTGTASCAAPCVPTGNPLTYGTNSWIGYVYNSAAAGAFTTYQGYVTEATIFNRTHATIAAGATATHCSTNQDLFAIRYRNTTNFAAGYYTFTVGGDDGVRFSVDGGATWLINQWVDQGYTTTSNATPVYLSGNTNMVFEYYENGGGSQSSFSYIFTPACSGTPTPGNTIASVTSVLSGGTSVLSLQNATAPATYQWQSSTSSTGPWTNIGGATSATYTATVTANTYYQCVVTCTASSTSANSNPVQITIAYCTPTNTNSGDYISAFSTTLGTTNVSTSGTSTAALEDYTSQIVTSYAGGIVNFSGNYVGGNAGLGIWIDWNNNYIFDASELVYVTTAVAASWSGSISVPAGQALGNYRMRIRAQWNAATPPACGAIGYGQAEDYTFTVTTPPACTAPTGLTSTAITASGATISWTAASPAPASGYQYYVSTSSTAPAAGTTPTGTTAAGVTTATLTGLSGVTTYYFWVRSNCGGTGTSSWSASANFTTLCGLNTVVLNMSDSWGDGWNGATYTLVNNTTSTTVATGTLSTGATGSATFCVANGCYQFTTSDDTFDEMSWSLTVNGAATASGIDNASEVISINSVCGVPGCTDPASDNYNPLATVDNGSCLYLCASATALTCGTAANYTSAAGTGAWNSLGGPFATPGIEQLFTYTPTTTANYTIAVTSNAYADLYYSTSCGSTGWTYVDDISGSATNTVALTGGTTYYFLLDMEGTTGVTGTITASCYTPPAWTDTWVSMNTGSSNWCAGETRTISVTVTNTGSSTWTDATPDINIGVKWNAEADYFIRTDAGGLAPGATQTYNLTVTAPITIGTNNLTFDIVNENNFWFANNTNGGGPGNVVYTSPAITINNSPIVTAGNDVTICNGQSTTLNGTVLSSSTASSSPAVAIPDNNPTGVSTTLAVSGAAVTASQITGVTVNITHTWDSDLSLTLIAPDGSSIDLSSGNGGSGDNYTNTYFTTSGTSITLGASPFTGSYTPEVAFSSLTGTANGTWSLRAVDAANGDIGTINSWSIAFGASAPSASYSWTPSATLSNASIASPIASPIATTTYTLTGTLNGCSASDAVVVTLPTAGSALAQDNENATCIVNQNGWVHFYHSSGRLIASVNSQGQDLGAVTAISYVEGAPVSVDACTSSNPIYATTVMGRHWVITPTNQPTSAVLVRLPYENTEFSDLTSAASTNANSNDDLLTPSDLGLSKYSNGTNANVNDVATDNCGVGATTFHTQTGNGVATSYSTVNASYADFSIPGFSEFWLHGSAQSSPLPVELVNFQANCAGEGKVNVTWATASEHNSANFTVEKSRDGMNWTVLASVAGAGNSTQMINYSTVDNNAGAGENYYRLTQADFDGASETFNIASENCGDYSPLTTVKVYPNPSAGDFYIDFNSEEIVGSSVIAITDARGMEVYKMNITVEKGSNVFHIENMEAAPGIYYIQVSNGTATSNIVKHSLR